MSILIDKRMLLILNFYAEEMSYIIRGCYLIWCGNILNMEYNAD